MAAELCFPALIPALLLRSSKAGSVIATIAGAGKHVVLEVRTGWQHDRDGFLHAPIHPGLEQESPSLRLCNNSGDRLRKV